MKIKYNAEVELVPCPFCGCTEFEITSRKSHDELVEENGGACIVLGCKCGLQFYIYHDYDGTIPGRGVTYDQKLQILAEKWNRRANNG